METHVLAQKAGQIGEGGAGNKCEQASAGGTDVGDFFLVLPGDSVVALGTGAAANLVCLSGLARRNRILERRGMPLVAACTAKARFRFGDGRPGDVRHAA